MTAVGDRAPAFTLPDTEGTMHEPGGAPATVVVFTCNHCPYALAWHDRIVGVARVIAPTPASPSDRDSQLLNGAAPARFESAQGSSSPRPARDRARRSAPASTPSPSELRVATMRPPPDSRTERSH